jgi:hypothetical protein
MPDSPDPLPPQAPHRSFGTIIAVLCGAIVVLCGAALLPSPARLVVLVIAVPPAAVFLPSILFSAANARCPACRKPLPLGFNSANCPSCGAALVLKSHQPSNRV